MRGTQYAAIGSQNKLWILPNSDSCVSPGTCRRRLSRKLQSVLGNSSPSSRLYPAQRKYLSNRESVRLAMRSIPIATRLKKTSSSSCMWWIDQKHQTCVESSRLKVPSSLANGYSPYAIRKDGKTGNLQLLIWEADTLELVSAAKWNCGSREELVEEVAFFHLQQWKDSIDWNAFAGYKDIELYSDVIKHDSKPHHHSREVAVFQRRMKPSVSNHAKHGIPIIHLAPN